MQLLTWMSPGKKVKRTTAAPQGRNSKALSDALQIEMDLWREKDKANPALGSPSVKYVRSSSKVSENSTSPGSARTSVSTTVSQGFPTPTQSTVPTQSTPSPKKRRVRSTEPEPEPLVPHRRVVAAIERRQQRLPESRALSLPSIEKTFESDKWLTDASISFVYTLLSDCGLDTRSIGRPGSAQRAEGAKLPRSILLMDPATAFRLATGQDAGEVSEARDRLELGDRRLVVCPVSGSGDGGNADGGSHWSLLVGWAGAAKGDFNFVHYDSMAATPSSSRRCSSSYRHAQQLAARLAGRQVAAVSRPCPQHERASGYDSGMYVLLLSATAACAALMEGKRPLAEGGQPVWEKGFELVTPEKVMTCREQYHEMAMAGI